IVDALLEAAITLTRAELGNVALCGPGEGSMRLAAQQGFELDFLNFFDVIDDSWSACGLALAERRTVQVYDVASSHVFDRGLARAAVDPVARRREGAAGRAVRALRPPASAGRRGAEHPGHAGCRRGPAAGPAGGPPTGDVRPIRVTPIPTAGWGKQV